jgi:predicted nucleic acid-binding protein
VYINGVLIEQSPEATILDWLATAKSEDEKIVVVISSELIAQISRVARRIRNKDWSGEILSALWNLNVTFIKIEPEDLATLSPIAIPREDIEIYIAAKLGGAQCFISSNRELVRAIVEKTKEFECLTPIEFVKKYLE